MLSSFFQLKEKNTTIKTECIAGLVTFCSMVYIMIVTANMFTNPLGTGENPLNLSYEAIYISTGISAIIASTLMGLLANLPLALANGMGLNSFFIYAICISSGFSYANALTMVLVEGLLFVTLTLTGVLKKIYAAIPDSIRNAMPVGIGFFIALIGFKNSGILSINNTTGFELNSFNLLHVPFSNLIPTIICLVSLFVLTALTKKNIKGAMLWGIIVGVILYYFLGLFVPDFYKDISISTLNPLVSFKLFFDECFFRVFTDGFNFSSYINQHGLSNLILTFITTSITFCLVNIFDNIGSTQAATETANLSSTNEIPNFNRAMLASSLSATSGAILGSSTVTTYIESITGIMEGGRTGLTSIFTALFFFIALFLSPIAQLVPNCATASVLIYVGILMMSSAKNIKWDKLEHALPSFLTISIMPFTGSISHGIVFGVISYTAINFMTKEFDKIKPTTWILTILFILSLLFSH